MTSPNQDPTGTPTPEATLEDRYAAAYDQVAQLAEPYFEGFRQQGITEEQLTGGDARLEFLVGSKDQIQISIRRQDDTYIVTRRLYWPQYGYGKQYHLETSVDSTWLPAHGLQNLNAVGIARAEAELKTVTSCLEDLSDDIKFTFEGLLLRPRRVS